MPNVSLKKISAKRPNPQDPHTRLLPQFDIISGNKTVGYISRGHGMLNSGTGKAGNYAAGLKRLERFERSIFKAGKFENYKTDVLRGIGVHRNKGPFIDFIMRLSKPVHIEFWRKPATGAYFMRRGYMLCSPSIAELEELGLTRGAKPNQIHDFLESISSINFRHGEGPLLILTKPIEVAKK